MTTNETLGRFRALKVWKRGSLRAPHKPLLILLALGRIQRGEGRLVRFLDVEDRMWAMLQQFGQTSGRQSPDNPFWYMRSDGLWEIPGADLLLCPGQKRPAIRKLRQAKGGFPEDIYTALVADPDLVIKVARAILDEHFPTAQHIRVAASAEIAL